MGMSPNDDYVAYGQAQDRVSKLESDRAKLIDLLNRSQNMRPGLLMVVGYVPEPVLEFCNEARSLLRELEGK